MNRNATWPAEQGGRQERQIWETIEMLHGQRKRADTTSERQINRSATWTDLLYAFLSFFLSPFLLVIVSALSQFCLPFVSFLFVIVSVLSPFCFLLSPFLSPFLLAIVSVLSSFCFLLSPFLSPFLLAIVSVLSSFCFLLSPFLSPFLLMSQKWTWECFVVALPVWGLRWCNFFCRICPRLKLLSGRNSNGTWPIADEVFPAIPSAGNQLGRLLG